MTRCTRELRRVRVQHGLDFGFHNVSIICFFLPEEAAVRDVRGLMRGSLAVLVGSRLRKSLLAEHTVYVDEFFPASSPGRNLAHAHNCVLLRVRITVCCGKDPVTSGRIPASFLTHRRRVRP